MRARRWLLGLALCLCLGACLWPQTRGPFGGDEPYIFANLHSPEWRERLFAFNASFPGRSGGAWYNGSDPYQRRYVRVLPSLLLLAESRAFGSHAPSYKRVTLLLHLLSCLLGFHLLQLWLGDPTKAFLLAAPLGAHPLVDQTIDWVACQPVAVAALASLGAASALAAQRGRGGGWAWAVPALAFCALTSYEAAVAIPLLLFAFDALWLRARSPAEALPPGPRFALLGLYPAYALLAWANLRDATLTDASYRAPFSEFWTIFSHDFANYLVRSVVGRPPFYSDEVMAWIGQPWVLAVLLAGILALLWRLGRGPITAFGVLTYLALLLPPLLTRSAVSFTNLASNRQLYLSLLGIAIIAASCWRGPVRARHFAASGALLALCFLYHFHTSPGSELQERHARMGEALRGALEGLPPSTPIVVIGRSRCGYDLRFDAAEHPVYDLVPLTYPGRPPDLEPLDDHTLAVRSEDGLRVVVFEAQLPSGRVPFSPPAVIRHGQQRLPLATVSVPELPSSGRVADLRFEFDAPLTEHAFFSIRGCEQPRRIL